MRSRPHGHSLARVAGVGKLACSLLVGYPKPSLFARLTRRRVAADRTEVQANALETFRIIGSRGYAFDEEYLSDLAARAYDRAYDPGGYLRQLAAIANLVRPRLLVLVHQLHGLLVLAEGRVQQ